MALGRNIVVMLGCTAVLLGWGHMRANAAETRIMDGCRAKDTVAGCACAIDNFNAEVGLLGRALSAAPLLHHLFAVVYETEEPLREVIAAECGQPGLLLAG